MENAAASTFPQYRLITGVAPARGDVQAAAPAPAKPGTAITIRTFIISTLLIAYAWETLEHYLEADSIPLIMHWMQGVEFWGNRLLADPAAVLSGALVQRSFGTPRTAFVIRVGIAVWLGVHLFVFADCMVLQRELPSFGTLFGDKATAWTDVWTLDHFMSGMSIGAWLGTLRRRSVG